MEIVAIPDLQGASGDLLVLPVYQDRVWGPGAEEAVAAMGDWLEGYLEGLDFIENRVVAEPDTASW